MGDSKKEVIFNKTLAHHIDYDPGSVTGVKNGISIEVEYGNSEWIPAVVDNDNTGSTLRLSGNNDKQRVFPVVSVFKHGEREPVDVCFLNKYLIYDNNTKDLHYWKMFGEPWEEPPATDNYDDKVILFNDMDGLRDEIEKFVPDMFVSVLEQNREMFESLPKETQNVMTTEILKIKDAITERLIKYFVDSGSLTPGSVVVLDTADMLALCNDAVEGIYKGIL